MIAQREKNNKVEIQNLKFKVESQLDLILDLENNLDIKKTVLKDQS